MPWSRPPLRLLWIAFAIPLLSLGLLLSAPVSGGFFLPIQILVTLAVPLGIASIGFAIAGVIWHLSTKGYFVAKFSNMKLQSLPLTMALIAGMLPLLSGAAIMAGWFYTRNSAFEIAGLLNILVGLIIFGFGAGGVTWHLMAHGTARIRVLNIQVPVWAVILLLLSNFPAAYICVSYALSRVD